MHNHFEWITFSLLLCVCFFFSSVQHRCMITPKVRKVMWNYCNELQNITAVIVQLLLKWKFILIISVVWILSAKDWEILIVKSTKRKQEKSRLLYNFRQQQSVSTNLTYIAVRVHTSTEISTTFNIKRREQWRTVKITWCNYTLTNMHTHTHTYGHADIHLNQMSSFPVRVFWFLYTIHSIHSTHVHL